MPRFEILKPFETDQLWKPGMIVDFDADDGTSERVRDGFIREVPDNVIADRNVS